MPIYFTYAKMYEKGKRGWRLMHGRHFIQDKFTAPNKSSAVRHAKQSVNRWQRGGTAFKHRTVKLVYEKVVKRSHW